MIFIYNNYISNTYTMPKIKCNAINNLLCNTLRKHYLESRQIEYMSFYNWDRETYQRFLKITTFDNCPKLDILKNKTFEEKIEIFKD